MIRINHLRINFLTWLGSITLVSLIGAPVLAVAAISQGYHSDSVLQSGTIVSLREAENKVEAADITNTTSLLGIVVGPQDTTLKVSQPDDVVAVATSGTVPGIVSTLGGEVKTGDPVTVSPLRGVGMRASVAARIIGVAEGDAKYQDASTTVSDSNGKTTSVRLGTVPISVQPSYYSPTDQKSIVPSWLQQFANTVAGKPVSLVRLVISALLFLIGIITVISLLFSAVRHTLVSIGRNPLAKTSIYRGLWQIIGVCMIVFSVSTISAFVVLTR